MIAGQPVRRGLHRNASEGEKIDFYHDDEKQETVDSTDRLGNCDTCIGRCLLPGTTSLGSEQSYTRTCPSGRGHRRNKTRSARCR